MKVYSFSLPDDRGEIHVRELDGAAAETIILDALRSHPNDDTAQARDIQRTMEIAALVRFGDQVVSDGLLASTIYASLSHRDLQFYRIAFTDVNQPREEETAPFILSRRAV